MYEGKKLNNVAMALQLTIGFASVAVFVELSARPVKPKVGKFCNSAMKQPPALGA